MDKRFWLSTVALVLGAFLLCSVFAPASINASNGLHLGILIILGTLTYRSAKKRKLGLIKDTRVRRIIEICSLIVFFLLIVLQNHLTARIMKEPITNVIVPVWVMIAYLFVINSRKKLSVLSESETEQTGRR